MIIHQTDYTWANFNHPPDRVHMIKHWWSINQNTHKQALIIHQTKYTWANIVYSSAKEHMTKHWYFTRVHKTNIYYQSTTRNKIQRWLQTNQSTHDLTLINQHLHQIWLNINKQPTRALMTNWWISRNCQNNLIGILPNAI